MYDARVSGSIDERPESAWRSDTPLFDGRTVPKKSSTPPIRSTGVYYAYKVTSYAFSMLFMTILMVCAFIRWAFKGWAHEIEMKGKTLAEDPTRTLTTDLAFYIRQWGLDLEEHRVTTADGFILIVYHIVSRQEHSTSASAASDSSSARSRKPVLLIPGLMQSCASYCTPGQKSLAHYLYSNNFDVWLGNNRGGFKPLHTKYKSSDPEMWDWDMFDLARYDVPAMVKYVSEQSKYSKISVIGHSQGTTQTFLAFSRYGDEEVNEHVDVFCALSPAMYAGSILYSKMWIGFLSVLPKQLFMALLGPQAFMPYMVWMRKGMTNKVYGFVGYVMFSYLFNWTDELWNIHMRSRHFLFSPVYASTKLMYWWLGDDGFRHSGSAFPLQGQSEAELMYRSSNVPKFALVIGGKDNIVNGFRLEEKLKTEPNVDVVKVVKIPQYSHLDVLWAKDVLDTVGVQILDVLLQFSDNAP